MKVSAIIASGALLAQTVSAHYIFQKLNGSPAYTYFRTNSNYNSPVAVGATSMRCNEGAATGGSTQTLSVRAGSQVTIGSDTAVYHNGPILYYLGRVPSGQTASSWDGSGANWFKFAETGPSSSGAWPLSDTYSVTIPSGVASGTYLLRVEQIGLHNPGGDPQFYIGCAQIEVTGGGSCSPSYFSIPGHISASDPGITVNIYTNFNPASYKCPGPNVQSCNGGGNPQPTTIRTTTTARTTTGATTRTTTPGVTTRTTTPATTRTTTPSSGGGGAPLYGQCGGIGWTGPTTCAQGRCVANGAYYSQCVQ